MDQLSYMQLCNNLSGLDQCMTSLSKRYWFMAFNWRKNGKKKQIPTKGIGRSGTTLMNTSHVEWKILSEFLRGLSHGTNEPC